MDWIEVEYLKLSGDREAQQLGSPTVLPCWQHEEGEEEFVDLTPCCTVVGSPVPTVCSPVPSLYLVVDKDKVSLFKRPKALLPPIIPSDSEVKCTNPMLPTVIEPALPAVVKPEPALSVKDRVKSYEQSLSSPVKPRPVSPTTLAESQTKAIRGEQYNKPKNVEAELRRYQAMKRQQKYDQRARQAASMRNPLCPGMGGSGRYRSPTYPPSPMLTSPYRSLQWD